MISSAVAFSVGSKAPVVLCDFTEKLVGLRSQFFHLGGSYRIVVVIQPVHEVLCEVFVVIFTGVVPQESRCVGCFVLVQGFSP